MPHPTERRTTPYNSRRRGDTLAVRERDILSAILDTAGALIAVVNVEGRIVLFNRACEEITGVPAVEAVGRRLWEVVSPPEAQPETRDFFLRLLQSSFPETHERIWWHRDGGQRLILWRNTAIFDPAAKLEYVIGTGFDITESRAAKQELQQRSWELGERVKELDCLYGISQLGGRQNMSLPEFLTEVVQLIPLAWQFPLLATARLLLGEDEYCSQPAGDGAVCQSTPMMVDGQQVGLLEVCYRELPPGCDSDPFLPEENALLHSIADRIGHEISQHWSAARIADYQVRLRSLASELALTGQRERRRIAQELHDQVGHSLASIKYKLGALKKRQPAPEIDAMQELLERAIAVSRNLTFELSPPVLHELGLGAALEWLVHQLRANFGIAGEYVDDHQPKPLNEDLRAELFQAVRELLVNVGKHAQASSAQVRAEVEDGRLRIEVSDDGQGFDYAARLARRSGSDGWGLFSIRERLAHLGAQLAIDSTPGQGTRVTILAPLGEVEAPAARTPVAAEASPVEGVRILLVDDQALIRAGLRTLLEQQPGFEVVAEAGDGEAALKQAKKHQPDVVVMDIAMPGMNGIEATRQILASCPETRVIALSMHADGQYVLEMLRAGAAGYLLKDCAHEDLARAIGIVRANLTFLSPGLADSVAANYVAGQPAAPAASPAPDLDVHLTPRELQVLELLAQGLPAKAVALQLKVSLKTIETHRTHIMEKLDEHTLAGLTKYAIRRGLIDLGD
jgi:PAS domain S-box-containing protein